MGEWLMLAILKLSRSLGLGPMGTHFRQASQDTSKILSFALLDLPPVSISLPSEIFADFPACFLVSRIARRLKLKLFYEILPPAGPEVSELNRKRGTQQRFSFDKTTVLIQSLLCGFK
ncbi:hypothetical protein [Oscillibacter ruminantium]|uniref:hypothetical protein n=1 Tax=Oscillibacter ruminantium TaxID=1263547 RepID=UPI0033310B9B